MGNNTAPPVPRQNGILKRMYRQRWGYILLIPVLLCILVFHYFPMYGVTLAFKKFTYRAGIMGSPWVGFVHFQRLLGSMIFRRSVANTLIISLMQLAISFPMPIIFALMLNEVQHSKIKRIVQSVSYMPHFINWVIVGTVLTELLSPTRGAINRIVTLFGGDPVYFLAEPRYFRWILVFSNVWKSVGWGSIIYLAGIAGIDMEQYEAAWVDGATRIKCMRHITIPGLMPLISIQLILCVGSMLNGNFDQVFNLYNSTVYETGDIIDTYAYRVGLEGKVDYSLSTAISLFKNGIGCILVVGTNWIAKKLSGGDNGLW